MLPLLPILAAAGASALPADVFSLDSAGSQLQLQADRLAGPFDRLVHGAADLVEETVRLVDEVEQAANRVVKGVEYDLDQSYTLITHPSFPSHTLRLKQPQLCDPNVTQYSGYLDVAEGKHLFFWYFDSRHDPANDPLVMWLNGGPGCSSITGLLFELGPCRIRAAGGAETDSNPHSWTEKASVLFLDQPVKVGYSWTESESVGSTKDAAEDVKAFMQLWYKQFPETRSREFHIAGESYGGHYVPNFASAIHHGNAALRSQPSAALADLVHVPLTSILIGNGLTDPLVQFPTVPDYACAPSPYAIFDENTCTGIRGKVGTCTRLVKSCYDSGSRWSCVPAQLYCNSAAMGPITQSGRNPYDIRRSCDRSKDGDLCYKEMEWIEGWMNRDEVKKELGVPSNLEFQSCNMQVNGAFSLAGDGMHNSAAVIPEMLDAGIKVLIYAGEMDFMCEWMGNKAWVLALDNQFHDELASAPDRNVTLDGVPAAEVRQAGSGAGNFTFVKVYNAGHMVPMDQPEYALDMFSKWLANEPLYDKE